MLRDTEQTAAERLDLSSRFRIAQDTLDTPPVSDEQLAVQSKLRLKISDAARMISREIEPGREASLALTHLEEALMWAGKAIFK